jgi:hypothetical protein
MAGTVGLTLHQFAQVSDVSTENPIQTTTGSGGSSAASAHSIIATKIDRGAAIRVREGFMNGDTGFCLHVLASKARILISTRQ